MWTAEERGRLQKGRSARSSLLWSVAVLGLSVGWLFAGDKPQTDVKADRAPQGAELFRHHCASCHGADATGQGPAAAALKHTVPDLTRLAKRNGGSFPLQRVKLIIEGTDREVNSHGSREMPVWGPVFHQIEWDRDLGYVRLEAVTHYLASIQKK